MRNEYALVRGDFRTGQTKVTGSCLLCKYFILWIIHTGLYHPMINKIVVYRQMIGGVFYVNFT